LNLGLGVIRGGIIFPPRTLGCSSCFCCVEFKPFGSKRQHVNTKFLLTHCYGLPYTGCMVEGEGDEFLVVVRADVLVGVARKGPGDEFGVLGPLLLVEAKWESLL
jgi:hypothetical protein